jgi:hypothetical protein
LLTLRHALAERTLPIEQLIDFLAHDVIEGHLVETDRKFFHLFDAAVDMPRAVGV